MKKYIHQHMSIIFLVLFYCTTLVSCTKDDEVALLKIKQQLGDPDFLSTWVEGFHFCNSGRYNWGIGCNARTGSVNSLRFQYLNLTAPFPDAICDLTELENLVLRNNPGLYGTITCISKLFMLEALAIEGTSLSGSLPNFMNHINLTTIMLRNNNFSGTIPSSLSTLQKLNQLDLSSNYLSGTIPSGLVHGLYATLILFNNSLTGELPRCYGRTNFGYVNLGNNQLSGDASFLFGNEKTVMNIVLANNKFEFDLSDIEISDQLGALDLSHNKIYGKVPNSFSAGNLYVLDLSFNTLCGEIPQGGIMSRFTAASFENNACLCGYPLPSCSTSAPAPGHI